MVPALNGGKPEQLTLLDILRAFVSFRESVVSRRTKYLLRKARDRAHVLVGLAIAVANIDEIINLIRRAPDPQTAREQLMERHWPARDVEALIRLIDDPRHKISEDGTYQLSEEQARAILELRLQRLTGKKADAAASDVLVELHDQIATISDDKMIGEDAWYDVAMTAKLKESKSQQKKKEATGLRQLLGRARRRRCSLHSTSGSRSHEHYGATRCHRWQLRGLAGCHR